MLDNLLSGGLHAADVRFRHHFAPPHPVPRSGGGGLCHFPARSDGADLRGFHSLFAPLLGIAAYALGYWMQIMVLELGTLLSLVGSSLVSYATEGQQKRYIKSAYGQYLSPTIIEELIAHPGAPQAGRERDLSIFFSDLQGFTTISEALGPEELTALLNEYLTAMTDIIQEKGEDHDKYEGDAIAFWNAPLTQEDHAVRAVRAALRCQARLDELRPILRARVKKDLYKRIGVHNSGPAVVGNFGSHTKFNYTMLGDAVNLASRLEGVNKQFKTFTMISAMVKERLGGAFPLREVPLRWWAARP